jgi:hypothetical protein
MNNLFEMIMQAQGGNAVNNMAQQFGLAPQQAQSAIEALLPAFSTGMQKQSESVDGLQSLIQMFGGGQHAETFDADGDGIPDNATQQGNDVLGQLFGNKDVSRAVAAQASMASGVSSSILKQMLPVVASMLMGGLFKGATNNGLGGLMGQAMQGGLGNMFGQQPQPQQQANNPMGDLLGNMLGGGQARNANTNAAGGGLMGGMLGNILGGMLGGGQQQAPAPAPTPDPMMAGLDMLKGMFQSGQQVQQAQTDSFQSIFEQFTGKR